MLTITVRGDEIFDEASQTFDTVGDVVLELEHSLVSLSKWESIWEKPFLASTEKTTEEVLSYVLCMNLGGELSPEVLPRLSEANMAAINKYINAKMTATWFNEAAPQRPTGEMITAELVYYWMVTLNIPFDTETWHLNRLFTLIKVINLKNTPQKKLSRSEAAARQRELNRQRREQYGTSG